MSENVYRWPDTITFDQDRGSTHPLDHNGLIDVFDDTPWVDDDEHIRHFDVYSDGLAPSWGSVHIYRANTENHVTRRLDSCVMCDPLGFGDLCANHVEQLKRQTQVPAPDDLGVHV